MISFAIIGTCLDFAAEDRRVTERNAALEKMSAGVATLWSDPRRRSAIVLLLDREGFRSIVNQKISYGCEQESQDLI